MLTPMYSLKNPMLTSWDLITLHGSAKTPSHSSVKHWVAIVLQLVMPHAELYISSVSKTSHSECKNNACSNKNVWLT